MAGRFPMRSDPTGWYRVAGAHEIGDSPLEVRYFGQTLSIRRGPPSDGGGLCALAGSRRLPVREANGLVVVHWSRSANLAPTWEPPSIPEIGAAGFSTCEEYAFVIRTHVQEIAENIVDPA